MYREDGTPLELLYQRAGQALARYWYVVDGQGSVVALVDTTGAVVDQYRYDLWGQPEVYQGVTAVTREGVPQPLRYRGYWDDGWYDGAGLWGAGHEAYGTPYHRPLPWYWLGVRCYDPRLRRFLQPDPSTQGSLPDYSYANNDPLDVSDPAGLDGSAAQCGQQSYTNDPVQHARCKVVTLNYQRDGLRRVFCVRHEVASSEWNRSRRRKGGLDDILDPGECPTPVPDPRVRRR